MQRKAHLGKRLRRGDSKWNWRRRLGPRRQLSVTSQVGVILVWRCFKRSQNHSSGATWPRHKHRAPIQLSNGPMTTITDPYLSCTILQRFPRNDPCLRMPEMNTIHVPRINATRHHIRTMAIRPSAAGPARLLRATVIIRRSRSQR